MLLEAVLQEPLQKNGSLSDSESYMKVMTNIRIMILAWRLFYANRKLKRGFFTHLLRELSGLAQT